MTAKQVLWIGSLCSKQPADLGVGKSAGQPLLSRQTDFFCEQRPKRLTVYR